MKSLKTDFVAGKARSGTGLAMPKKSTLFVVLTFAFLSACGPSREFMENEEQLKSTADSVGAYLPGLSADTINGLAHHFIRTADLRFKVKDVQKSSRLIENIVSTHGGYIADSELSSSQTGNTSTRANRDSVLEQTWYLTVNHIRLRIPNHQLDSALRQIENLALFTDYKRLKADDVKMKLYANQLSERRYQKYQNRLEQKTTVTSGKTDQVKVEESLLNKATQADQSRLESLSLAEQVNYSTVELDVYQSVSVLKHYLPAEQTTVVWEPPFYEKAGTAFADGFHLLKLFVLFLIRIWSLILIITLCVVVYRKWGRPRRSGNTI